MHLHYTSYSVNLMHHCEQNSGHCHSDGLPSKYM